MAFASCCWPPPIFGLCAWPMELPNSIHRPRGCGDSVWRCLAFPWHGWTTPGSWCFGSGPESAPPIALLKPGHAGRCMDCGKKDGSRPAGPGGQPGAGKAALIYRSIRCGLSAGTNSVPVSTKSQTNGHPTPARRWTAASSPRRRARGVVLAAVLDLKVQPRAPAFAGHLAAVGFAGQVHPGAGAVFDPVAVGAERRVCVQAEALGAAALGQRYLE